MNIYENFTNMYQVNKTIRMGLKPICKTDENIAKFLEEDKERSEKYKIAKKIIDKEIPATIIYEDEDFLAVNDINPSAKIHVLVIPKKEIKNLDDATEEDIILLGKCQLVIAKIARQLGIDKSGYRVITNINSDGGQEVYHLHYHLLGGEKLRGF